MTATETEELIALRERLAAEDPFPDGSRYVPVADILIDHDLNPRDHEPAGEIVAVYAANIDNLPPIRVERGTMRLIGGNHRLQAHLQAGAEAIRVIEVDTNGGDIFELAFVDNAQHGVPYKAGERVAAARRIAANRRKRGQDVNIAELAKLCGISRQTVYNFMNESTSAEAKPASEKKAKKKAAEIPFEQPEDDGFHDADEPIAAAAPTPTIDPAAPAPGSILLPVSTPETTDGEPVWETDIDAVPESSASANMAEQIQSAIMTLSEAWRANLSYDSCTPYLDLTTHRDLEDAAAWVGGFAIADRENADPNDGSDLEPLAPKTEAPAPATKLNPAELGIAAVPAASTPDMAIGLAKPVV